MFFILVLSKVTLSVKIRKYYFFRFFNFFVISRSFRDFIVRFLGKGDKILGLVRNI